ncbi:gliding motility-associated ABC transporter ATP-binding subunit GldA [Phnomibacter ginsenosidimutans]|uniref:Gliding motility-associated ABC transporter ATP-binding subunit GldA n=1 Tax=Phnomibacter ginsenosidimutans TaxID=2676868 RepID=A0A6I6GAQ5_9BACT|nr:gliding motility-associated ABC transporter ATP-binding subunit GldA [Phnomibacter ginsenosidimutans]QGW27200.1 gliding motility-associated ABC transporter ATP-binding subunit GldA [Phnomibacter ginsenosidimutans]
MSIQVQQLCKQYGSQLAVNNISFEARPGQITGFLGPNGAGKSTTMKMLTGYLQPDSGTALVSGLNVVSTPEKVKQQIGYLPESNALYYDLYIREYLAFTGALYKVSNLKQRVEEVITQVGLTIEANKKIGQLSKGYKQRVGLAAAIIHNPAVLILDEPTTGLDPNQIVEIRQVIKTLSEDKTVLLSTHIMQEVEAICEQVIIINKGSIVANAPLQQLRSKSDGQQLRVSFAETIEAEWLLRLPGILAAEKTDSQSWTLQTNNAQDARKALMQLALNENLNIRSMQEGGSLEAIFRELTTNTVAEK